MEEEREREGTREKGGKAKLTHLSLGMRMCGLPQPLPRQGELSRGHLQSLLKGHGMNLNSKRGRDEVFDHGV